VAINVSPADVDVLDGEKLLVVAVEKTTVAAGSMCCGHSSSSKMLEGKT
jgi:hypothetical protein